MFARIGIMRALNAGKPDAADRKAERIVILVVLRMTCKTSRTSRARSAV